jgi:ankyrin repeat protein
VEKGAPVDARSDNGSTPLMLLVTRVDAGEDDPENREDLSGGVEVVPWPCARERQQAERAILAALLQRSPDLDARNSDGVTALLFAAARKRFDLVIALQEKGADINAADRTGATAIFFAPRASLKSLVKAGADINAANANGDTILHVKMRTMGGQRLVDFVNTALRLGARDSRNKRGEWASEQFVDSISFLQMDGGFKPLDALRKRLRATRATQ